MLNTKQRKFCLEYVKDFNGTQAAIRAGYSKTTAGVAASKMLKLGKIYEYIEQLKIESGMPAIMSAEEVLENIANIARDGTESGRLKALDMLGRYYSLFTEKQKIEHSGTINRIINVNPTKG